jgi:hypothetical protein
MVVLFVYLVLDDPPPHTSLFTPNWTLVPLV